MRCIIVRDVGFYQLVVLLCVPTFYESLKCVWYLLGNAVG